MPGHTCPSACIFWRSGNESTPGGVGKLYHIGGSALLRLHSSSTLTLCYFARYLPSLTLCKSRRCYKFSLYASFHTEGQLSTNILSKWIFADTFSTKSADSLKCQHLKDLSNVRKSWLTMPLGAGILRRMLACRTIDKRKKKLLNFNY